MKISNSYSKLPLKDKKPPSNVETENKAKKGSEATSAHSKKIAKNFTTSQIRKQIEQTPDVNMERVKEIKERIAKNEFKIDSKKIVQNLLKDSIQEDI